MLTGYRILDLTDERGHLAGKILGDLGADVIKVEPPGGDPVRGQGPFLAGEAGPERSLRWLAGNTSKRGIVLDPATDAERWQRLLASADVLLETFAPGEAAERGCASDTIAAAHPWLVHCAITPFGRSGPYAHLRGHDLVSVAMGGNPAMTGDGDRPPVRCSMPTGYYHAGSEAALAVLMALYAREDTGRGQFVDVSIQECQLQTMLSYPTQYIRFGGSVSRSGGRLGHTREIWRAKDGWVTYGLRGGPARIGSLTALTALMHENGMAPDWLLELDWKQYNHNELSADEIARFEQVFGDFFRSKTMRELYEESLARRILLAPCNDAREILEHTQLRDRKLFATLDYAHLGTSIEHPDFFAKAHGHPISLRRRAPRLGEHDAEVDGELAEAPPLRPAGQGGAPRDGIFAGLNILELGSGAAGPVATRYFAEQGARIIRIESSKRPDFLRVLWLTKDSKFGMDGSPMFICLNPDKESLTLNLTTPEGAELVKRLVEWADVVQENFAPGVMEKFGLDYDELRRIKPELVMASGCLFGQTGPQRKYPGFGGQGSAISGFNHVTGWPDREPHGPYGTITDSLSPRYVATALAAALLQRRRTGEGEYIDLSQIECGVYSLSSLVVRYSANGEIEARRGNASEWIAPCGHFPCQGEDRWIAIEVQDDAQWRALAGEIRQTQEWADDVRFASSEGRLEHRDELEQRLGQWTAGFERFALMERLQAAGVEAAPVQDFEDLKNDPQLAHRRHWVPLQHVHLGELWLERSGFRLSASEGGFGAPGPNLGADNHRILGDLLGLEDDEIARLEAAGVVE